MKNSYFTITQACEYSGLSRYKISKFIKLGLLKEIKRVGSPVKISGKELSSMLSFLQTAVQRKQDEHVH